MEHSYSNTSEGVTSTLQALCQQEENAYRIEANYLNGLPAHQKKVAQRRAKCRAAMVNWCITVVDYLEFERDTVATALSYLDRFLETDGGRACLTTPRQFKIAGMTCLYTAIKAHEPEAIEPDLVVELSGDLCSVNDIEAMERTILKSINWRVNPPTALSFCRQLVTCIPSCLVSLQDKSSLLDLAQVQTELAVSEPRLITTPPSILALACIYNALESKHSEMETLDDLSRLFSVALSSSRNHDMDAVFDVQDILDDIIRQQNEKEEDSCIVPASAEQQHSEEEDAARPVQESRDHPSRSSPRKEGVTSEDKKEYATINVSPSTFKYEVAEAA